MMNFTSKQNGLVAELKIICIRDGSFDVLITAAMRIVKLKNYEGNRDQII